MAGQWFAALSKTGALAVAIAGATWLSLWLSASGTLGPLAWLPSGIAAATLALHGSLLWPGVLVGALVGFVAFDVSWLASLAASAAYTLEAVAGAALFSRSVKSPSRLEGSADVLKLLGICAALPIAAAIVSAFVLSPEPFPGLADFAWTWLGWWEAGAVGMMALTPLVFSIHGRRDSSRFLNAWELVSFAVLLGAVSVLVFAGAGARIAPFAFVVAVLPFILWAAYRFDHRIVASVIAAVTGLAVWFTAEIAASVWWSAHTLLQAALPVFVGVVALTGLLVEATRFRIGRAVEAVRRRHHQLENRLNERALQLEQVNRALQEDMRARTRAEKLLQESEERFRMMVESVTDYALYMLDPRGKVASWNAGASRIYGYHSEEACGQPFALFYPRVDVAQGKPQQDLERAATAGRIESEGWRVRKDGSTFWANVIMFAVHDAAGKLIGFTKVTRDLTERRHVELELVAAKAAAERASQAKSEFLATMSHELRTPLNSLLILSRLLSDNVGENLTPKQVEYARTIHSSGLDLLALINDILDLAKIESGAQPPLNFTLERFSDLKSHIERTFRQVAESRKLRFEITLAPAVSDPIWTDAQRLQQILKNLLSNAFKFTREGGVSMHVDVARSGWRRGHEQLEAAARVVAISVTDTGIGIPEDKQALIFEPFQQADGATSREFGGTGLGLSISRALARLLSGDLQVRSRPGEGSTFTLYLPFVTESPGKSKHDSSLLARIV